MTSLFLSEKGLGLLQIMFMMVALAVVASVAVMNSATLERGEGGTETFQRFDQLKEGAALFRAHGNGNPPTLDSLFTAPAGAAACSTDNTPSSPTFRQLRGWCGPYVKREATGTDAGLRDGWNSLLQLTGTTLRSCGPNRSCGDADDLTTTL